MMNGEVVDIDIAVDINDAVGILYLINPVMARKRLDRVNMWVEHVAAGIINLHKLSLLKSLPDMKRIDDACGNITQHDASRSGQDAFAP
ncbi:MAG: hypothetical protein K2G06_10200 [Muribaculaceae bacterium]|nr:hypothetical protein [Muribaculaceae bacterium]